ncbi:hypothetical protein KC19_10G106400 [Ceratodon purpureus]|uniref:Uncharacterized protein n=1 Tax=Ceratodon purpureus TaxID=3225 RepID=A0A8T0GLM0_CERPU|nr:hypothetical protein KC19_10G106400 [Ceratodon purpureus]
MIYITAESWRVRRRFQRVSITMSILVHGWWIYVEDCQLQDLSKPHGTQTTFLWIKGSLFTLVLNLYTRVKHIYICQLCVLPATKRPCVTLFGLAVTSFYATSSEQEVCFFTTLSLLYFLCTSGL